MLNHEEIFEGAFIISDYNTLGKEIVGILQNIRGTVKSGLREGTYPKRKDELAYDIFFPETGETTKDVCEHSGVTSNAISTTPEKAELYLEQRINENNQKILTLRASNITLKESFEKVFQRIPTV